MLNLLPWRDFIHYDYAVSRQTKKQTIKLYGVLMYGHFYGLLLNVMGFFCDSWTRLVMLDLFCEELFWRSYPDPVNKRLEERRMT